MAELLSVAHAELILGGQKSGKSRRAELLAQRWLAQSPAHEAVLIATALAHDDEMRERIARHRADRALRVPGMRTVEEPRHLSATITAHSRPGTLVVVDCLTLWLTQWLMPADDGVPDAQALQQELLALSTAIAGCGGPIVLVSNEIGLGVIPLGRDVRRFVDALGNLNQSVAQACARVTLMAAGCPLTVKEMAA
ncbi:bifunctional adenosylcobinamide kinase/adenosylcobinamide-phosphate guanylyltransferase [Variovorax sp. VNK109]|uniref:bifunctional adenosylcobinamide kinase/adenosylcobinamide-phosphate guanylyltransferase n=1 Tax=Variovorax sp. VNK109 TaxID=3400919 RepID=UPI003C0B46C1